MPGHVRFVSILCVGALSATAFAEEPSESGADAMRQPGGLYDATPHTRSPEISIAAQLYWRPGIGVGGRYFHPLLPDGFLPELNDSFEIGGGFDFYPIVFYNGGMAVEIPAEARWTFHLFPNLAAYAMLSLGVEILFGGSYFGFSQVNFWNSAGAGILYQLNEKMSVVAELSYHGLRAGVAFVF